MNSGSEPFTRIKVQYQVGGVTAISDEFMAITSVRPTKMKDHITNMEAKLALYRPQHI